MTTSLPSAAKAAADEICDRLDIIMGRTEESDVVATILRHVEPIVRAVEVEREELRNRLDQLISSVNNQHTDARHHDNEWGPAVTLAMDTRMERDQALAKLAAVENERDEARLDRDKLRCAMVFAVNQTDSAISDACSIDFLCQGGGEIASFARRLRAERDSALTRADSAGALLREADNRLRGLIRIVENELPTGTCKDDAAFCSRITSHFAMATANEGKK